MKMENFVYWRGVPDLGMVYSLVGERDFLKVARSYYQSKETMKRGWILQCFNAQKLQIEKLGFEKFCCLPMKLNCLQIKHISRNF